MYFAAVSVYPVWSLWIRLALALSLVALAVMSGSRKLRDRRTGQHWSSTHPVKLTHPAEGSPPRADPLASGIDDAP
jgi:hypothetical protein